MRVLRTAVTWLFAYLACANTVDLVTAPEYRDGTLPLTMLFFFLTPISALIILTRAWNFRPTAKRPPRTKLDHATMIGEALLLLGTAAGFLHGFVA